MPAIKADGYGMGTKAAAKLLGKKGEGLLWPLSGKGASCEEVVCKGKFWCWGTPPGAVRPAETLPPDPDRGDAAYGREMEASGYRLKGQVKVDTGMHRLGRRLRILTRSRLCTSCPT